MQKVRAAEMWVLEMWVDPEITRWVRAHNGKSHQVIFSDASVTVCRPCHPLWHGIAFKNLSPTRENIESTVVLSNSRAPTGAKLFPIGLGGVVAAYGELFRDAWRAEFWREPLQKLWKTNPKSWRGTQMGTM